MLVLRLFNSSAECLWNGNGKNHSHHSLQSLYLITRAAGKRCWGAAAEHNDHGITGSPARHRCLAQPLCSAQILPRMSSAVQSCAIACSPGALQYTGVRPCPKSRKGKFHEFHLLCKCSVAYYSVKH